VSASKVRFDHDLLSQIANTFGKEADNARRTLNALKKQKDILRGGDWIGEGANKFYDEMDSAVLPAMARLANALETAQRVTGQISRLMQNAEDEAAALFTGSGGPGGLAAAAPMAAAAAVGAAAGAAAAAGGAASLAGAARGAAGAARAGGAASLAGAARGAAGAARAGGAASLAGAAGGAAGAAAQAAAARNNPTERMLAKLDPQVRQIAAQSPTLGKQLDSLESNGWTIVRGTSGGGSYADRQSKSIVIDPNQTAEQQVSVIAHEVGHAGYAKPPQQAATPTMTRDQYVAANVNRELVDEGNAQLNAAMIRGEIQGNKGPDIGMPGTQTAAYQGVYDKFKNGSLTRDQAVDQMGNLMGNERTSTTGENYRQYYGKPYEKHWDKNIAPARGGKL